jgi:hypothetical protein
MSEQTTAIRIRVECNPYAPDSEYPIRLLVVGDGEEVLTELKFTPARARETAYSVGRMLTFFIPASYSHKLAEALRTAAAKVWATRN